tara:strand:+ start:125 stop:439 length:315 start_codon:yes stop_codon:yes gene_type:complete
MFCPKCGAILLPKKEGSKTVALCSCGYRSGSEDFSIKEKVAKKAGVEVIEEDDTMKAMPLIDAECPKCKNKKARFWTQQTRASDEPETKFLKCEKCKHTWRDYL